MISPKQFTFAFLALLLGLPAVLAGQTQLQSGFLHPPASARPWVYCFWLNGNVTSNGITADLEAMKKVGIGGVLIMDVDQGTPKGPVAFASQQWRALFQHTCAEAHRLGLQVNMNNDPGWCGSGGPWVTPELSMQKLVWSETILKGPAHIRTQLPQPETLENFYRDIAVVAFPTLAGDEVHMADFAPHFRSSDGQEYDAAVFTGAGTNSIHLSRPTPDNPAWLQVEFTRPFTARELALKLKLSGDLFLHGNLEASDDGHQFKSVKEFNAEATGLHLEFDPVTARFFRVLFRRQPGEIPELTITSLELSPHLRIENIDGKALFLRRHTYPGPSAFPVHAHSPPVPDGFAIPADAALDLSSHLSAGGQFEWDVPAGSWTVLRFGHTSNGTDNHPAPQGGHGLECDKLRKEGVQAVFNGFLRQLSSDVKPFLRQTFVSTHIDSWEVGSQNWTEHFRQEFLRRRHYDLLPFLPVITGRVVGSRQISERFLQDFRQTISDLLVDNYAGELRRLAHNQGLRLSIEAYDGNPCDDLTYGAQADDTMAEFWSWPPYEMDYSCPEMASVAHVYGKTVTAAEAFTASETERWLGYPYNIKAFGDWAFCQGINRFVVHRYAFQPWTKPTRFPGMSMGPFGLHYERTQTWWEQSVAWHQYLARCQYLLQQGRYVADICYVEPEVVPQHWVAPFDSRERVGYAYDVCPPQLVVKEMSVKNGRLLLPSGMSYRLLVLPSQETMTPELLAKVASLVKAGANVLAERRPLSSPSLTGYPACDSQVQHLADELWGSGPTHLPERRVGKGSIFYSNTPEETLARTGLAPDFCPLAHSAAQSFRYIHRDLAGTQIYFVANNKLQPQEGLCAFRVAGAAPQLWWPESGRLERCASFQVTNGLTLLPLRLEPAGSVFVIFPVDEKPTPDHLVSIERNYQPLLSSAVESAKMAAPQAELTFLRNALEPAHASSNSSNFTMAVWAKPSADIPLPKEANEGDSAYMLERNDALFPPPGHEVFGGPEHAGAGLDIGRNGVYVLEHAPFYFAPVLVFAAPVTNWTHIAKVYEHGRPRLYLNGQLVHEGLQSTYIVHSGVGVRHRRGTAPFQGQLGDFFGAPRALNTSEIKDLMKSMPVPQYPSALPSIQFVSSRDGEINAEIWEPGMYSAQTAAGRLLHFQVPQLPPPQELTGPWQLDFPPGWGAPEHVELQRLISWTEHPDAGVRHFSGTATYTKTFTVSPTLLAPNQKLYLELGTVCVSARVKLNGKDLGILWKPPFRIEVTQVLKPGENVLQLEVVNLWVNRMIGDESLPEDSDRNPDGTLKQWPAWLQAGQPSPTGRFTFTTWRLWKKDEPLRQSGLLGPVRLLVTQRLPLNTR